MTERATPYGAHGKKRTAAILLIGTLALTIATASAVAGKGLKTQRASVAVPARDAASATATCPRGTKAVSGGYRGELGDPSAGEPQVVTHASRRAGKRKWTSAAVELLGARGRLTSFAYCRREKIKARAAATRVPVASGDEPGAARVAAKCPRGMRVVSGGFANSDFDIATGTTAIVPYVSRKAGPRRWVVGASNIGDAPATLVAQANCHHGKKLRAKRVVADIGAPGEFEARALRPGCRRTQRVVSGGFKSTPFAPGSPTAIAASSRRKGKRGWRVLAAGMNGAKISVHAYCEKE